MIFLSFVNENLKLKRNCLIMKLIQKYIKELIQLLDYEKNCFNYFFIVK